jgi:hypothetical protein
MALHRGPVSDSKTQVLYEVLGEGSPERGLYINVNDGLSRGP